MSQVSDDQSTAQTDTVLVAAPGADKQIAVTSVYVSTDTAQTVSLESGNSTLKWRQYCAANGGSVSAPPHPDFLFACTDGEALTYSSSAAGNVFVLVSYQVVPGSYSFVP